jgi:hypothetical protein
VSHKILEMGVPEKSEGEENSYSIQDDDAQKGPMDNPRQVKRQ